jgi:hypothetical protein
MNSTGSVALAIGVGYVLGRRHKLRTALMLGGAVASGRLSKKSASGGDEAPAADGEGMFAKLGGAGRAAARAALTRPAERLGDRLAASAASLRHAGEVLESADAKESDDQAGDQPSEDTDDRAMADAGRGNGRRGGGGT